MSWIDNRQPLKMQSVYGELELPLFPKSRDNAEECHEHFEVLVTVAPSVDALRSVVPTHASSKKRHTYVWQCCDCGSPSLPYRAPACPSCEHARCGTCTIGKVQIRRVSAPFY
ncbi:hypothetical protein BKA63DRAFT_515653 [Paraphoma chrysanthemicola]|nr:hypothetical protein BKA63DRAFT_515653 [Paraphoma chrysanthemicola]